jgi:hypothetical protein
MKTASWIRIAYAACMVLMLAACNSKPPIPISTIPGGVANLATTEPEVSVESVSGGRRVQTIRFTDNSPSLAERYSTWFKDKGWGQISLQVEVNTATFTVGKDGVQVTINYTAGRGTYLRISAPEKK